MTTPRILPVSPPYAPDLEASLKKWMPKDSAIEPLLLFRTIARHPLLSERMRPLGAAFLGKGTLPMRVRELAILRTCARCGAEYEWGVHAAAFGAAAGLDEGTIASTWVGAAPDGDDGTIVRAVDQLHDHGTIDDRTWDALRARFDEPQLLELLALSGFYHLISFIANGARIELEPWALSAGSRSAPAG